MGRSDYADHENVFSDLTLGSGDETDEDERKQGKRASGAGPEEARCRAEALPWTQAIHWTAVIPMREIMRLRGRVGNVNSNEEGSQGFPSTSTAYVAESARIRTRPDTIS